MHILNTTQLALQMNWRLDFAQIYGRLLTSTSSPFPGTFGSHRRGAISFPPMKCHKKRFDVKNNLNLKKPYIVLYNHKQTYIYIVRIPSVKFLFGVVFSYVIPFCLFLREKKGTD